MKYADFMGKDIGVNLMNCIAKASQSSSDVRDARSAMNILDEDGGAPKHGTAAMHGYNRKRRDVSMEERVRAAGSEKESGLD